jgi:hypothetical protein
MPGRRATATLLALAVLAAGAGPGAAAAVRGTVHRSNGVSDRTWNGRNPPYLTTLSRAWDVPISAVRVTPVAGGRFHAWEMTAPATHPRF